MPHKSHQHLREEAQERLEVSREGKPSALRGRSRQRAPYGKAERPGASTSKVRASVPATTERTKPWHLDRK